MTQKLKDEMAYYTNFVPIKFEHAGIFESIIGFKQGILRKVQNISSESPVDKNHKRIAMRA